MHIESMHGTTKRIQSMNACMHVGTNKVYPVDEGKLLIHGGSRRQMLYGLHK
jgi:hypothetical protein